MFCPTVAVACRKQERSFELSEVVQRRRELELHAEQRAKDEAFKARAAAREKAHEARRKDVAQKRELLLQQHMKQACHCLQNISDYLWLNFIYCSLVFAVMRCVGSRKRVEVIDNRSTHIRCPPAVEM